PEEHHMSRLESSKVVAYGLTGKEATVQCSKLVAYVLMVPGDEAGATPPARQAQVFGQIVRNVE
ncbi:MAG TPA: hypothetical protein VFS91_00100, partial [Nitrobacter sp.]|nr:hypothetical protein [Nitrobacter sp.]